MKADKKLKNLIEKQGLKLKADNYDFYQQMLNIYPEKEEKQRNLWQEFVGWFSVKKLSALACCVAVLVVAIVSISNLNFAGKGGVDIIVPYYAERVASVSTTDVNVGDLAPVERTIDLMFNQTPLSLGGDTAIYEDGLIEGKPCYYYATKSYKKGFFRLQLITDKNYSVKSNLTAKTQNLNVKGVEFTYSTLYVESVKTVYFFAEALSGDEKLTIDFTVSEKDAEKQFIDLLNSIIL